MVGNVVRAELATLGKRQTDLLAELRNRGFTVAHNSLSQIISGKRTNEAIENAIWDIIKGWRKKHEH